MPPGEPRYRNTFDAIRSIYKLEGFRAFYKGLLPSLLGVSHVAVQFPLYEKAKAWAETDGKLTPSRILICSASSKMVASLITYPHEVLRTRLQIYKKQAAEAQSHSHSNPTSHSHSSPNVNVNANANLKGRPNLIPEPIGTTPTPANIPGVFCDAKAGFQQPPERIPPSKWKPRTDGVIDTFLQIKRQDGWRGFYRGLSINLVRTVPNSAVTMLTWVLFSTPDACRRVQTLTPGTNSSCVNCHNSILSRLQRRVMVMSYHGIAGLGWAGPMLTRANIDAAQLDCLEDN